MSYLSNVLKICILGILLLVGLSTTIGLSMSREMDQGLSEDDKMLYRFINRQGKRLEQKYQMKQCAVGLGGVQVWLMALSFQRYGDPLTEEEARKLIINCVNDFLDAVNNDEQIRPFLKDYPFTAKNLDLKILNYSKNQILHYFPHVAIVTNTRGKIGFFTQTPSTECGYHTEKYETYDEAVAILKREK